jgi:hypothetical protein
VATLPGSCCWQPYCRAGGDGEEEEAAVSMGGKSEGGMGARLAGGGLSYGFTGDRQLLIASAASPESQSLLPKQSQPLPLDLHVASAHPVAAGSSVAAVDATVAVAISAALRCTCRSRNGCGAVGKAGHAW